MKLSSLRVVHLRRRQHADLAAATPLSAHSIPGAFYLDSCQRKLWVASDRLLESAGVQGHSQSGGIFEILSGAEAYEFLVRVAAGLESEVLGETDIFGQLKEAWKSVTDPRTSQELGPWIRRLFEDTKEVRSRYLQNLGGGSYGTLLRRMIREQSAPELAGGPILVIGAGQIARSVTPFLLENELWLWNRSQPALFDLYEQTLTHPHATGRRIGETQDHIRLKMISSAQEERRAWERAAHVVVCIPVDPLRDGPRIESRLNGSGLVIHLGALRGQGGAWSQVPGYRSLDDLFDLQRAQGEVRSVQIARAHRFCQERAQLRSLGNSVSLSHGWEDLAVFG